MSALNGTTRRLMSVPAPEASGGLSEDTVPELLAAVHFYRGVLVRLGLLDAFDEFGGSGTREQRDRLRHEAWLYWAERARTFEGVDPEVDRLRSIGATGYDPEDQT